MRELEVTEIENVSGAGPQGLTDVSQPDYYDPNSYEFAMADCMAVSRGFPGTGACGNAIASGIQAENQQSADNESQSGDNSCGYLADLATIADAVEEANTRTGVNGLSIDTRAYAASEAADAALRACVSN